MKPNFSQTLLLAHFYMPPPPGQDGQVVNDAEHYEDFYEDVLEEMIKFGDVEELVICENLGDHMFGNTYVKFATEEQAHKALINLRGRYYCGRIVQAEYSPVTDFREGRCRQFDEHNCLRGGYCNFLHLKSVPRFARRYLRRTRLRNRHRHPYGLQYQKKHRNDDWPRFPVRGNSEERRRCIAKWNKLLKERKEKEHKRKMKKALKEQKRKEKEQRRKEKKEGKTEANDNGNHENENENGNTNGEQQSEQTVVNGDGGGSEIAPTTDATNAPFMNPERLQMLQG
eukprot:CAMPEP_0202694388 /NCGR_PEP_ID=MMETSP1385-20130828/8257_1 /ASSEMBLY_ACC=CAM_ASM_000861 /TAXON_ID=933848 /ORGANISM="Elphidium margaritaceum" /LENGTH=283 /DNA_ID=CAMNT_0049350221 /DNA_START=128 /DNA_END=979 /DNA_ORIENTATION=-